MRKDTILFLKLAVIIIGIIVFMLFIFWLPWLANSTSEMYPEYAYLKYPVLIGVYTTGIPFYIALYNAFMLLNYIKKGNAFSEQSVNILNNIKKCAISVIIVYVAIFLYLLTQNALHPGIAIILFAIIFTAFTISLFAAVLQELLSTALEIKSENDLTV